MAYLAVNKNDGCSEVVFEEKPERNVDGNGGYWGYMDWANFDEFVNFGVELPHGTIEKLIGKKLTWEDEPVYIG